MSLKAEYMDALSATLSSNEAEAKEGLEFFKKQSETNYPEVVEQLFLILESNRVEIRLKASSMLLSLFTTAFNSIYDVDYVSIILPLIRNEKSKEVRNDLIAILGYLNIAYKFNTLEKVLPWLEDADADVNESAVSIITHSCSIDEEIQDEDNIKKLVPLLTNFMKHKKPEIRLAAMLCAIRITDFIPKAYEAHIQEFGPLTLNVLQSNLNSGDTDSTNKAIMLLTESLTLAASIFSKKPEHFVSAMHQIAKAQQLKDSTRMLSLNFLACFGESVKAAKKIKKFNDVLLPLCLDIIAESVDENTFNIRAGTDSEKPTLFEMANECIDRICLSMGGRGFAPVVLKNIELYMKKPDWQSKLAAVMAVSQTGEGCREQFLPVLGTLVKGVLELYDDKCARLRFAAIHCTGQMCTDFAPIIQERYGKDILKALLKALDDPKPEVQDHTQHAIINIMEHCPENIVEPFVHAFIMKLVDQVSSPTTNMKMSALTAIAAIAGSSEGIFHIHYNSIMPLIRENVQREKEQLVVERLFECASLIVLAVGYERCSKDLVWLLKALSEQQWNEYTIQAYNRIIKCMDKHFLPHLETTMNHVQEHFAKINEDMLIYTEASQHDLKLLVQLLNDLIRAVKSESFKYLPLMKDITACTFRSLLIDTRDMGLLLISSMLQVQKEFDHPTYEGDTMHAISSLLQLVSFGDFPSVTFVITALEGIVKEHDQGKSEPTGIASVLVGVYSNLIHTILANASQRDEEEDEEEAATFAVEVRDATMAVSDLFGAFLRKNTLNAAHIWNLVFNGHSGQGFPAQVNYAALLFICTCVEQGGPPLQQGYAIMIPRFFQIYDEIAEMTEAQQVFVFLMGTLLENGDAGRPFVEQRLESMFELLESGPEGQVVTNAISAVLKILLLSASKEGENPLIATELLGKIWKYFPLTSEDIVERALAMRNLVKLIENKNEILLGKMGENKKRLKKILSDWQKDVSDMEDSLAVQKAVQLLE